MKFEIFLQNLHCSPQTRAEKPWKSPKMAEELHFWANNYLFLYAYSTQLFVMHLFCNIAHVQVDLMAFYPENGHF